MSDYHIQNQVDFILFEEGCFSPLNWLLKEGHLDYNEYLNWRKGSFNYLEDHFKTSIATTITTLKEVENYAKSLKLKPVKQSYTSTTDQPLYFSRTPAYEHMFTTIFEPAHNRMQMDLFFDSADACAISDLIKAIIDRRGTDIPTLLEKLHTLNPAKHLKFIQLLGFEQKIGQSQISSAKKIALMLQKITPLSSEILGRFAHDFLIPLWSKLSEQMTEQHFNAEVPENHLSFTAFKGFQWQQVLLSVEREKNWHNHPPLIFRYAESCFKLHKERDGVDNWFKLFTQFPAEAERLIKKSENRLMRSDWQNFSELDPELESTLFPAWVVINKPSLAKNNIISGISRNGSLLLIEKLVCNNNKEINNKVVLLRRQLQQNNPSLFFHYMRAISADQ
jgi:hypothetical protein